MIRLRCIIEWKEEGFFCIDNRRIKNSRLRIAMVHTFFFSPSDTTRKYAKAMTDAFGGDSQLIDLTHGPCEVEYATVGKIFCAQNSKRREPELFL